MCVCVCVCVCVREREREREREWNLLPRWAIVSFSRRAVLCRVRRLSNHNMFIQTRTCFLES